MGFPGRISNVGTEIQDIQLISSMKAVSVMMSIISNTVLQWVICLYVCVCLFQVCGNYANTVYWQVYAVVNICLNSAIPVLILSVLNGFIIYNLHRQNTFTKNAGKGIVSSTTSSAEDILKKERQLTVMLCLVVVALFILSLPLYINISVFSVVDFKQSLQTYADYFLATHVTQIMFYMNSSINFFLYCLAGSKFRQDLKTIFLEHWMKPRAKWWDAITF